MTGVGTTIRRAANAVVKFVTRPISAIWNGGIADQWVAQWFRRPTAETLKQARFLAQSGDPELWYGLANECLRDSQIRTDVDKASDAIATANISIQEPQAFRSWSRKQKAKEKADPEAARATEIRMWVESQLLAPRVKLRQVLKKWARALIVQSIAPLEVRVAYDDAGEEHLQSLRPAPAQRLGWDWNRGGKMVLRPEASQPVIGAPLVEELGTSVVVAQLDDDIPDPTLHGITYALIALWILRDSCRRWWIRLAEKFGIPIIWATSSEGVMPHHLNIRQPSARTGTRVSS